MFHRSFLLRHVVVFVFRLACLACLVAPATCWLIQVDSYTDECFLESAVKDTRVGLSFQVVDGGFLDVDVKIEGPDGLQVYIGPRETSGKYTFRAYMDGKYRVCFSNKMSTITPKWVMFHFKVDPPVNRSSLLSNLTNSNLSLQMMVDELSEALRGMRDEQDYMMTRVSLHHRTGENTNKTAVRSVIYVTSLLFSGVLFQAWYYKRFFEVRRIV